MIKPTDPVHAVIIDGQAPYHEPGIDLRTWMAAQMMAACIQKWGGTISEYEMAQYAIDYTDKLIAELNEPKEGKP